MTNKTGARRATPRTHVGAVRAFLKSADAWLTDEDLPALTTLLALAKMMDTGQATPALISQYGLTYRSLLKRKPPAAPEAPSDPLSKAMADAGL